MEELKRTIEFWTPELFGGHERMISRCARESHRSEDRMKEDESTFVNRIVKILGHRSVAEHAGVEKARGRCGYDQGRLLTPVLWAGSREEVVCKLEITTPVSPVELRCSEMEMSSLSETRVWGTIGGSAPFPTQTVLISVRRTLPGGWRFL